MALASVARVRTGSASSETQAETELSDGHKAIMPDAFADVMEQVRRLLPAGPDLTPAPVYASR